MEKLAVVPRVARPNQDLNDPDLSVIEMRQLYADRIALTAARVKLLKRLSEVEELIFETERRLDELEEVWMAG